VGPRGSRIQNIVNELGGERLDVIKWDPDPAKFVSNALSPAQVLEVDIDRDEKRATVTVPDRMISLAIGKEGQNARLAAKLTGWRIDIRTQAAAERGDSAITEAPSVFVPFQPGEEPDIDIISEAEEVAAAAELAGTPLETSPAVALAATGEAAEAPAEAASTAEDDVSFAIAMAQMPVPDREERESEDYGEDDEEEYEVPAMIEPELRPTAIRFAEDVLGGQREAAPAADPKKAKKRRTSRLEEEEEDDIDYSGRIH
jgi:N utilization substance protein A